MSTLQDPTGAQQASSEIIKKNVNSHKNPVLSLKWIPNTMEIDRKFNVNLNTCKKTKKLKKTYILHILNIYTYIT